MNNKDTLRHVQDRLFDLAEQKKSGRIVNPSEKTKLPHELFEVADIVHELVGIIASQQEELLLMREQLRHLGIR